MHVIITCTFEKDRINNSREKVAISISDAQGYFCGPWSDLAI